MIIEREFRWGGATLEGVKAQAKIRREEAGNAAAGEWAGGWEAAGWRATVAEI